jgi:sugar phosphate isomerase/epimerase
MNHPEERIRKDAIAITKAAAQVAVTLGCNEVSFSCLLRNLPPSSTTSLGPLILTSMLSPLFRQVVVWSAFDGYDYPFQVDYQAKWNELVAAFQECCDAYPEIRWSIEYKPTDENTRFFTVPSTGAALLLAADVDRPNFGLTLDIGHMLMSGENPGQSIAMVGRANKLFGIQLNDCYTRLAAEDGLMFGSVHPSMALEIMFQLRRARFSGHVYFDTFPQRSDPVLEAEYNIRRVKAFWHASGRIDNDRLKRVMSEHNAIGALELVGEALKQT